MVIPAFKKFQNRLKPFYDCQNVGVHCKQFALQVSTDEIHKAQIDTKLSRISGIYLSPPQRLPLGIPTKISIIEKIESARGTMGTSPFPSCPARFLFFRLLIFWWGSFFFLPSLLTTQKPLHNTKRPLRRREGIYLNFSNIRLMKQLPLIMFSFDEEKTTSQIQE